MPRILIAGFQHETNTFGATQATMADFELADSWPRLLRGDEVIPGTAGSNLPLAGFVRRAEEVGGADLIPVLWANAEPASFVTDDAYEAIGGAILGAARSEDFDAIYLDLHGAMVTESHTDGEGVLLHRLRQIVGPRMPIVISLDLHANLTDEMVRHASAITMFRTYPHLDMAQTGGRAFDVLAHLMAGGQVYPAWGQSPYMIPLHAQYTGHGPVAELYDAVVRVGRPPTRWAEFAAGFSASDTPHTGPSLLTYAETPEAAEGVLAELMTQLIAMESRIDASLLSPDEAVARAMAIPGITILGDVQDNPGAGATSDSTGLLSALVEAQAQGVILGMLNDPEMAALAQASGVGGEIAGALGGKAGPDPAPYQGRFRVEALSDGHFPFTGEMYAGSVAETGPTAVLRVLGTGGDLHVVVGSNRCQCLDQAIFTHIGLSPAEARIVAVKSTLHFRADFDPIAAQTLFVAAPGLFPCQLDKVRYRHLRPGLRLGPMGPEFTP